MVLLLNYKMLAIGLLAVLGVALVGCGAAAAMGEEYMNGMECLRAMVSVGGVIGQRGAGWLMMAGLAGLLIIGIFGFSRRGTDLGLALLDAQGHWQIVVREAILRERDFIQEAFRRGIIHGQIYNTAYLVS